MLGSLLLFLAPAAYQCLAIYASLRQARRQRSPSRPEPILPGISVLKPVRGIDPNTPQAFSSQIQQTHRPFEVLFAVSDETDPSLPEIRRLQAEHPDTDIRLITTVMEAPNGKVGALMALARHARYPIWVVNDGDIVVPPEYLDVVTAPLSNPNIGVVTCLYRARSHTVPARWEALGIASDFMPSTLVAQELGVREFGLGSTLAFRAADLAEAGGFAALADYIADDYQLAKRITALGKRAQVSTLVVETALGEATWAGIWNHQLRWARTIRASKGAPYSGLFLTHAGVWIVALLLLRRPRLAAALATLRIVSAYLVARFVLADVSARRLSPLAPVWDLYAFAVWLTAHFGHTVRWRDQTITLNKGGRIGRVSPSSQSERR